MTTRLYRSIVLCVIWACGVWGCSHETPIRVHTFGQLGTGTDKRFTIVAEPSIPPSDPAYQAAAEKTRERLAELGYVAVPKPTEATVVVQLGYQVNRRQKTRYVGGYPTSAPSAGSDSKQDEFIILTPTGTLPHYPGWKTSTDTRVSYLFAKTVSVSARSAGSAEAGSGGELWRVEASTEDENQATPEGIVELVGEALDKLAAVENASLSASD